MNRGTKLPQLLCSLTAVLKLFSYQALVLAREHLQAVLQQLTPSQALHQGRDLGADHPGQLVLDVGLTTQLGFPPYDSQHQLGHLLVLDHGGEAGIKLVIKQVRETSHVQGGKDGQNVLLD